MGGTAVSSGNYKARVFGVLLAFGSMLATSARAQLEVGQNTSMTMTGDLGFGYNGAYGNSGPSSHGTGLNGDAVLQGYYYNPKFLNFFVDPVYNRSQANSGTGSITDATSINAAVNLFSGSHFPGSISYGQAFNSSGTYGLGTTPGFTSTGDSRGFGIGWSELVPNMPPLSVQYSQNSSASSIFGTDQEDHANTKNLNLNSTYKIDGWYTAARFSDTWARTELPSVVTDGAPVTGDTNSKVFSINANHKLPMRGSFGASYSWSDFGGETNGSSVTGANQMVSGTAAFAPTPRFTTSFEATYNSSVTGEVEQQLIGAGAVSPGVNLGSSGYSVSMSNYDNLMLTKSLSVGFSVGHIQQEVFGHSVEATHFSAVANYRFLKPLWGTFVTYAGINDQATDAGNQGAGLVAGINFSRRWTNLETSGSFSYSQDTQTILATQTTSNYSYLANVQRRLTRRTRWLGTFSGFHSGLSNQAGASAHSESYGTNFVFKMYNLGANYNRTAGTVLLTGNGLIAPPGTVPPGLPGNQYFLDMGSSYGISFTANPVPKLSLGSSFTRTINDSTGASSQTANAASRMFLVFTSYQYRKLVFTAGYTNLYQVVSSSGQPPASFTNFYVGIQRWFRAF